MVSGVTARQATASREAFNGPAVVLPPPPKRQCHSQNARAEARTEDAGVLMTKLAAKVETKAEERAREALKQIVVGIKAPRLGNLGRGGRG